MKCEGLYGASGVISKNKKYNNAMAYKVGWNRNTIARTRVDFVGHSWFLKKDWLSYMFEGTEEFQNMKICGEDMVLSYALQCQGINTYVPPQPKKKKDFNGSLYGKKLGADDNSLFVNNGWNPMSKAFDLLINKYHFKTIEETDHKLYHNIVEKYKNPILYIEKLENSRRIYFLGLKFYIPRKT